MPWFPHRPSHCDQKSAAISPWLCSVRVANAMWVRSKCCHSHNASNGCLSAARAHDVVFILEGVALPTYHGILGSRKMSITTGVPSEQGQVSFGGSPNSEVTQLSDEEATLDSVGFLSPAQKLGDHFAFLLNAQCGAHVKDRNICYSQPHTGHSGMEVECCLTFYTNRTCKPTQNPSLWFSNHSRLCSSHSKHSEGHLQTQTCPQAYDSFTLPVIQRVMAPAQGGDRNGVGNPRSCR